MPLIIPNAGELVLLDKMLKAALSVDEGYIVKLYQSNLSLTQTMVAGDLDAVEANFTGYVGKSLSRSSWASSVLSGTLASSTYTTIQSWTCGATGNTIYGYYVVGATSGTLLWAESFPAARPMTNTDILNVTPVFTFTHS